MRDFIDFEDEGCGRLVKKVAGYHQFLAVQVAVGETVRAPGETRPEEDLGHAVRQIISRAVAPEGVIDIFAAAGRATGSASSIALIVLRGA